MLFYYVQRGQWCGWWRRVPLQSRISTTELHERLTARGYCLRTFPWSQEVH